MAGSAPIDPFGETADPRLYVPRAASETALAALEQGIRVGQGPCALTGPTGIGKTLLLRVLADRLGSDARCVYVPYAALELEDLCRWILGLLGDPALPAGRGPVPSLVDRAQSLAAAGTPLVVMLDDAGAIPQETARSLAVLSEETHGALRLVVVPADDRRAGRLLAALGSDVALVHYADPLSPEESAAYVRGRLATAGLPPELLDRFDAATLRRLHFESGGNPRALQACATEVLRRGSESAAEPDQLEVDEGSATSLDAGEEDGAAPFNPPGGTWHAPELEIDEPSARTWPRVLAVGVVLALAAGAVTFSLLR